MRYSIQENLKKINSALSSFFLVSLGATALFLIACAFLFVYLVDNTKTSVTYTPAGEVLGDTAQARPFGSKKGTVYTFPWCQGSDQIKESNKIYFKDAYEAERTGRTLSKLCQR